MNIGAGSLEYAHARLWARWGERADEATWHRIEITRDLGAVLELARACALVRWVADLGPDATLHAIERALRRRWRERVAEVAGWMPVEWQPAIEWCARLVDLPVLETLARGDAPPPWTADDPSLRALGEAAPARPEAARVDPQLEALLAGARPDPSRLRSLWLARWRACAPRGAGRDAIERQLLPLLARHAAAFAAPDAIDGWGLRRALQARLVALVRRAMVEPLAAFAHLALAALELERLRAELVARAAFPNRAPAR